MIELRNAYDDSVPDANSLGDHRARRQEQLRRGAMRIFLEEVMLDGKHGFKAQLVGQFHLLQAVVVDLFFGVRIPGTRDRDFIEESKFHVRVPSAYRSFSNVGRRKKVKAATKRRRKFLTHLPVADRNETSGSAGIIR